MSSDNGNKTPSLSDKPYLVIPGSQGSQDILLDITKTRESEQRFIEAKDLNPVTYVDLEHTFNESYRELKRHHATIGWALAQAEKNVEIAKANVLLDKYPDFIKDKDKKSDNQDMRKAFMMRDPEYLAALDRVDMLKALESSIDGRIKVLENVCRYMRKRMDLILRSGLSGADIYNTQGRK